MAIKHLSQEQIQDFLDGNLPAAEKSIDKHLKTCSTCKKTYRYYQNLYSGLGQDPQFQLSSNFTHSVISRLPQAETAKARFKFSDIFIGVTGIAALVAVTIYFIDINLISEFLNKISAIKLRSLLASFQDSLTVLNGALIILGLGGLTLLCTAALDRVLTEPKPRKLA